MRVTVRLSDGFEWSESRKLTGTVVSPSEPRKKAGLLNFFTHTYNTHMDTSMEN